jgi:hypothetical protein
MAAVDVEATQVFLIASRTLREQCLARFLEQAGLDIQIVASEDLRQTLLRQNSSVDPGNHRYRRTYLPRS